MGTVDVRALHKNADSVLRRVAAGEIVVVTDRGQAIARIVPANESSELEQLQALDRASDASGDLLDVKPVRPIAGKPLLSQILAAMRADGN